MKKSILLYVLKFIIYLISYIVGLVITPINYFIKDKLRIAFPNVTWWFLNDTTPISNTDIDSGDYGRFKRNFIGYYKQNALRNSHWNLKILLRLKNFGGSVVLNPRIISLRYNPKFGSVYNSFKYGKHKLFQYSYFHKIGMFYIHGQLGYSNKGRELYKFKIGTIYSLKDKYYKN